MAGRGSGKPPAPRVTHHKSIEAAFERQRKRRKCCICNREVLVCLYAAHVNNCVLADSDSDVEVVNVLTGAESKALKAGPAIVIDEDRKPAQSVEQKDENTSDDAVATATGAENECNPDKGQDDVPIHEDTGDDQLEDTVDPVAAQKDSSGVLLKRRRSCRIEVSEHRKNTIGKASLPVDLAKVKKEMNQCDEMPKIVKTESEEERTPGQGIPYHRYIKEMISSLNDNGFGKEFWKSDYCILCKLMKQGSEALELLLRLFFRRASWFREKCLAEKYSYLKGMESIVDKLLEAGLVEDGKGMMTQEELFDISDLASIKKVAKMYYLDCAQNKHQIIDAFAKVLKTQKDIFGRSKGVASKMYNTFYQEAGRTVRVPNSVKMVLMAILTLTCPTETNSAYIYDLQADQIYQNFLMCVHEVKNSRLRLPAPALEHCNFISVYKSYAELKKYVGAKQLEVHVFLGIKGSNAEEISAFVTEAKEKLADCDLAAYAALAPPIRRFSPPCVLLRCVATAASAFEKLKRHPVAVELQRWLLHSPELVPFGNDLRGAWWERLTLNLESHMKDVEESKEELVHAFGDTTVADKDLLALEDRFFKITKDKASCRVLNALSPHKSTTIHGMVLDKDLGDGRINRFVEKADDGQMTAVSVENVAKAYYMNHSGFLHGVHAEGSIWHTVLGVIFNDEIFGHTVANAYLSPYQRVPTDLNYPSFFEARKEVLEKRLHWLKTSTDAELLTHVTLRWRSSHGVETSKIVWDLFSSPDELHEFVKTCGRKRLAEVFHYLLTDHRNTRSGFPDLTLWDPAKKLCMAVEVKGPGDRLSTKQRIWLHRLNKAGIPAEVCYVKAKAARALSKEP